MPDLEDHTWDVAPIQLSPYAVGRYVARHIYLDEGGVAKGSLNFHGDTMAEALALLWLKLQEGK